MSIVVAVQKENSLVMASDSQISFGSSRIPYENLKPEKMINPGLQFHIDLFFILCSPKERSKKGSHFQKFYE